LGSEVGKALSTGLFSVMSRAEVKENGRINFL
jgi:hypothetical protein